MQLSSSAIRLPVTVPAQPIVALLADGTLMNRDGEALRIGASRIAVPSGVAAAALVSGQVAAPRPGVISRG